MAAKEKQQKKKKGRSTQELVGIKTFTKYGLETNKNELLFYLVAPTNISVLSHMSVEIKIRHLLMVLSALPNIEITCTDSCECFDDNKSYLQQRLSEEQNPKVRKILKKARSTVDKSRATRYSSFTTLKRLHAVTRRVAPLRKHREKAAGVSLRERGAVNVT